MTDLFKAQTIFFSLYFVVPGFIILKVHEHIIPSVKRNWGEMLIELFGYSFFNLMLCVLIAPLANLLSLNTNTLNIISNPSNINYTQTFWISFVIPAIIGLSTAITIKSSRFHKVTHGIFLHPIPTAWDHAFGRRNEYYFILFHLKSGVKFGGFYGKSSFVSTFPNEQEIYVEEVWQIEGDSQKIEGTAGAFIKMQECTHIELFVAGVKGKRKVWMRVKKLLKLMESQLNKGNLNEFRKVRLSEKDKDQQVDQKPLSLHPGEVVQFQTPAQVGKEKLQQIPPPAQVGKEKLQQIPPPAQVGKEKNNS